MKKVVIALVIVFVIAVAAVVFVAGNIDAIVKGSIESIGTELMGVPVTVDGVSIKIDRAAGQISGLKIANPVGYSTDSAFRMDRIRLDIGLKSLGRNPIVIDELTIDAPIVNLEFKEGGGSNLQDLMRNMDANADKADEKAAQQQRDKKSVPAGEPGRLAFGKLIVKGVTVNVTRAQGAGKDEKGADGDDGPSSVTLPAIELDDVGGEKGLTPAQLGVLVCGKIAQSAVKSAITTTVSTGIEKAKRGLMEGLRKTFSKDEEETGDEGAK